MNLLLNLTLKIFIIGITTFGGGQVFIPLFKTLLVDDLSLTDIEGFSVLVAITNAGPGPLVVKFSAYSGYLAYGYLGAIVALAAISIPAFVIMILSCSKIDKIKEMQIIKDMNLLIKPIIIGIFVSFSLDFSLESFKSIGEAKTFFMILLGFSLSFVKIKGKEMSVFFIILLSMLCGIIFL